MPARDLFKELLSIPPKTYDNPVGTNGYTLPELSDLERFSLEDLANGNDEKVVIIGNPGPGNFVYLPKKGLIRPVTIKTSASLVDSCFVFDTDLTLSPTISAFNSNQLAVFSGGIPSVGHSGVLNVSMFRRGQLFFWGKGSTTNGTHISVCGDDCSFIVGDDCMFAHGVEARTHDMHAIISMTDGKQSNKPQSILLEPHVWIGPHVSLGRGVRIGFGSIVGAKSFVSRNIPRFSLAAGLPARVIKENISWDRKSFAEPERHSELLKFASNVDSDDL